jgi:hypothetical protein
MRIYVPISRDRVNQLDKAGLEYIVVSLLQIIYINWNTYLIQ